MASYDTARNVCQALRVGNFSSGRTAVCRFPQVPFTCSSFFNPTRFQEHYGFSDQLAARCDFKKDGRAWQILLVPATSSTRMLNLCLLS
jgi:hypothetical protein